MALIKLGAIVSAISGKLSGNIFSHNKGGPYVKNFAVPTNPQTPRQNNIRSYFSVVTSSWGGLTQAQRDGWIASAENRTYTNRLGEQRSLSGYGLFVKQNMALKVTNLPLIQDAPVQQPRPSYLLGATTWDVSVQGKLQIEYILLDPGTPLATSTDYVKIGLSLLSSPGTQPKVTQVLGAYNNASLEVGIFGSKVVIGINYNVLVAILGVPTTGQRLEVGAAWLNALDPETNVYQTKEVSITY